MFDASKIKMIGIGMVRNLWQYVKPFSSNTGTSRTDGLTDGRTDRRTELLYQYRASVCWRAIKTTMYVGSATEIITKQQCKTDSNRLISYSGCSGLVVEYRTRNREVAGSTHIRSTAKNLEQVANLLCARANSASYPQRDGKWVVAIATGWRSSVADWGEGVSASCTVASSVR